MVGRWISKPDDFFDPTRHVHTLLLGVFGGLVRSGLNNNNDDDGGGGGGNGDEEEIEEYWTECRNIWNRFVRVISLVCMDFMISRLDELPLPLSLSSPSTLLATLTLLHSFSESLPQQQKPPLQQQQQQQQQHQQQNKSLLFSATFLRLLATLHETTDVHAHPDPSIRIKYFEIAVRYSEHSLAGDDEGQRNRLRLVLDRMVGEHGVLYNGGIGSGSGSGGLEYRNRCGYLLLRLVKGLPTSSLAGIARPFVGGVEQLLEVDRSMGGKVVGEDTRLDLIETIGIAIGCCGERGAVLRRFFEPMVGRIDVLLAGEAGDMKREELE